MNILLDNGHKINNLSIYIDFVDYVRVFKFNNNLKGYEFFQINKLKIELMKTLTDFDFKIKKIIRVDFNVPLDENL
jgi:hypothetical protein